MKLSSVNHKNSPQQMRVKRATKSALLGLLNLTFLPVIAFIWLLLMVKNVDKNEIDEYHVKLAIKINIIAGIALIIVCGLMLIFGGLNSAYTWVYVITYFTFVHAGFILIATWALVVSWSGQRLQRFNL